MRCAKCGTEFEGTVCPNCGEPLTPQFCAKCGAKLGEGDFCPNCGARARDERRFCYNCGKPTFGTEYCLSCGVRLRNDYERREVSFFEAYKLFWKNFFNFNGRATLSEYWYVVLWNFIVSIGAVMLFFALAVLGAVFMAPLAFEIALVVLLLMFGYSLVTAIPSIALTVRRLHDTGRSGLWYLLTLLYVVGQIVLLVLLCMPSQRFKNQYDVK